MDCTKRVRRSPAFFSIPEELWPIVLGHLDEMSTSQVRLAHPVLRRASYKAVTSLKPSCFRAREVVSKFKNITSLDLRDSVGITSRSVALLADAALPALRHLKLTLNQRLKSEAFRAIGRLAELTSLEMARRAWRSSLLPPIDVLTSLTRLTRLTSLKADLWSFDRPDSLAPIMKMTTLEELMIQRWSFGDGKVHPHVLNGMQNLIRLRGVRFPCEWNPTHDVDLGDALAQCLAHAIPNITLLDINQWPISDRGLESIARQCRHLTSLNVAKTGISGDGVQSIAKHVTCMTHIDLSGLWYYGSQGSAAAPQLVLDALFPLTNLQSLHLQSWIYSERFRVNLSPLSTLCNLTELNLSDNWIEYSILDVETATPLVVLTQLTRLDLSDNNMSRDAITTICKRLTNLNELDLSNFKALVIHRGPSDDRDDDQGCETPLSHAALDVITASIPGLRHLTVNHPGVADDNLHTFSKLSGLTSLECYDFSFLYEPNTLPRQRPRLTDDGLVRLCCAMPRLSKLDLQLARVRDLSPLGNLTALESLTAPEEITDESLVTLPRLTALRQLTFRSCSRLRGGGFTAVAGVRNLAELVVCRCATLEDFAFRNHISKLASLQKLELDFCANIGDATITAVSHLTRLKCLSFEQCCKVTMRALGTLTSLTRLVRLGFTYHESMPRRQEDWYRFLSGSFPHLRYVSIRHAEWLDGSKGLYMDWREDRWKEEEGWFEGPPK